jgi:hypothetical protein
MLKRYKKELEEKIAGIKPGLGETKTEGVKT